MKAGQITRRGRIDIVAVADPPAPRDGEVVVSPETGCLCGSDIPFFADPQPSYPLAPGLSLHEIVGRVTAGESRGFPVGARVLAMPLGLRGCFEQLLIGDDRRVLIDAELSNEEAVLAQPMATVLSALSTLPNVIGQTVAVVGQGPIGLLFDACLSSLGAARIIGVDVREARLAHGCEFGATDVVPAQGADGRDAVERVADLTGGAMADLVVEAVGHEEQAFDLSVALCRARGRMLYFGVPPDRPIAVALEPAFRKSLTIHTSVPDDLRPFVKIAMRAIRLGRIDPRRLVTHRFAFDDIQPAFETYRDRREGALKVILSFEEFSGFETFRRSVRRQPGRSIA
jgi:threonine dehydrogenase-like Zn-dependent dehydrogenase